MEQTEPVEQPKQAWWHHLTSSRKRRLATGSGITLVVILSLITFLAYQGNFALGEIKAAQTPVNLRQSDQQLTQQLIKQAGDYGFVITYPDDKSQSYTLGDAGISVNGPASASAARQAVKNLGWQRYAWWQSSKVPLVTKTDKTKFDSFVVQHVAVANQKPTDASLSTQGGKAVITDGVNGSTYQIDGGNQRLTSAARSLQPLKAKLVSTKVAPGLQRSDLTTAAKKIDDLTGKDVTFVVAERTMRATPSDIASWLDIDPVPAKKTVDVSLNSGKLQAFLDKKTAGNIYPATAQINTTAADGSVTVLAAGRDGSNIVNKSAVVKNVISQMQQAGPEQPITANLEVSREAFKTINAADYPKWLVADVSSKRMYAYEHNQLVRSFLISAGGPKTPTVLGTYQIYNKLPIRTMRGANADGSRYEQPNVKYVNYFYKDYAIHGNYWRPKSYFGNINSSHGCVGITDSDAEWIYNWASIGTTVITHN